jgi:hypothetical protein
MKLRITFKLSEKSSRNVMECGLRPPGPDGQEFLIADCGFSIVDF